MYFGLKRLADGSKPPPLLAVWILWHAATRICQEFFLGPLVLDIKQRDSTLHKVAGRSSLEALMFDSDRPLSVAFVAAVVTHEPVRCQMCHFYWIYKEWNDSNQFLFLLYVLIDCYKFILVTLYNRGSFVNYIN